jgi:hypothetical protein
MTASVYLNAGLDADSSDAEFVRVISKYLLDAGNPAGPFQLAYEFDARHAPPPVRCDRIMRGGKLCAIDRRDRGFCERWVHDALGAGLYVERFSSSTFRDPIAGCSIDHIRRKLVGRLEYDASQDEIPF